LVKLWTDVEDSADIQIYMSELRERLQQQFRQKVIYITAQRIRIP